MRKLITIGMNTIRGFAGPAFNFLIIIFGIANFGKDNWGVLINAQLWVFFMVFILSWGHKEYLLRKYSEFPSRIYYSFFSNFLSRSILLPLSFLFFFFFPFSIALYCVFLVVLMYCYDATYTLMIYHQRFSTLLITEILGFLVIISGIYYYQSFDLILFLQLYCCALSVKLILTILVLKPWKEKISFQISIRELTLVFPFFLLGFSGWLTSKVDIYIVDFYLSKSELSEYQLLITSFLMLQALSAFITLPFTKHMYRVSNTVFIKIKKNLSLIAIPVVIIGSLCIWLIMEKMVLLNFDYTYYILGALIALPSFYYTLDVIQLLKRHKEQYIIWINFIAIIFNIGIVLLLINSYKLLGILIGVCFSQWIILVIYKLNNRYKNKNSNVFKK